MKAKTNLIRFIQLWGIILIIGIGSSIIAFDLICAYHYFNSRSTYMRAKYISRQKQMIKQEVKQVVDIINHKTAQSRKLAKEKLKSRVYEAYSIAKSIYLHNKARVAKSEIEQIIVNALRPINFANHGYYFISDLNGRPVLFPGRPELVGTDLSNYQDSCGQYITKDMIKIVKKFREGFYEYHWTKPGVKGNSFDKIAFIKLFEPYNWLIGAGLYVEDIENQIKSDLLNDISRIRFGREGYIFINRFNGDALISNGRVFYGKRKLWDIFNKNSAKIKNIFSKELHAAMKPNGDYIYYSFIKLTNSNFASPKTSFIYGIPGLRWIVGAGVYLDDVEHEIDIMQSQLGSTIKTRLLYFFLITGCIISFFLFLFNMFTRRLKNDFNLFISFFDRARAYDETINRDLIEFEELDCMAGYANDMIKDRIKSRQALLQEKERLFVTIRSIGDGVITTNRSGKVVLMNRVAEELTGWNAKDAENRALTEVFNIVNSITRKKARNPVNRVLTDGKIANLANHTILISKQGREYQIADSAAPIKNSSREIIGVVLVFRDVTEDYRMQEELQKMQKLKSVGILAGGIAHDFNNIMTGLFGNISIVKTKLGRSHPEFKFLEKAESSMGRAIRLTKQLLTFAKGGKPVLEEVAVDALVKETVIFDLSGSNVKPVFDIAGDLCMAKIDKGQIQQVLSNLTINATQAMPKGGRLYITMRNVTLSKPAISEFMAEYMEEGKYIKIVIRDEGCGIEKGHLDMIFDPYFTTRGTGNGLGLAIAYSIIKKHGGYISVSSEFGKGSSFTFYLPACDTCGSEQRPAVKKIAESSLMSKKIAKILIMDDDEAIRMVAGEMLEAIGFSSEPAADGIEAIKLYAKALENGEPFDVILMDLTIPGGMGGEKAVREILSLDPQARVIVSSGYADDPVLANYEEYGFKAIIIKPYTINSLKSVLEDILKER